MERKHEKYQRLLDFCKSLPPTPTAVVHPCDESSLAGAVDAAKLGLIAPILVGPKARIEAVAKAKKIPLQHEAMSSTSGTDTDVIFWTRGGIASALISLPNRYMHSPVEVVSLKDLEQIPQLLAAFVHSVKKGEKFKVKI